MTPEQRRQEALKRFGITEGFKDTAGKPVVKSKAEASASGEGKEGQKAGAAGEEEEPDWNEIWGDYIEYMDHQRTQGWKT